MPVFLLSVSLWLLSAPVVQLGTVIVVFVVVSKDTALCGNFLGVFKNTFFKEALESYLGRELASSQLLVCQQEETCWGGRQLAQAFPHGRYELFPLRLGPCIPHPGEDGPCCLFHQFSGAWDLL